MTSRLGSVGQRCPPVSGEGSGQGVMLMSDSHYCRAVTTSTSRIHPSPHSGRTSRQTRRPHSIIPSTGGLRWVEVQDSMRRSGWDDSAGKEVRIENRARWRERDVAHVPERDSSWTTPCFSRLLRHAQYGSTPHPIRVLNERQSIGDNLPWSPLTTRGNHGGANSSPGPTRGTTNVFDCLNADRIQDCIDGEWEIRFMEKKGDAYVWPVKDDVSLVPGSDISQILPPPTLIERGRYKFIS
ncbi:hypothetical protein PoB_001402000 [Plakobranchus ocellatus]|uniref:Uncharacterized protein n=1 Tax=Plakobranchus ocellatus TaxID=259542 RepID=A0AAV3YWC8_9GAST|nr:hypothetical protein PoB_001402000 [Plakobranchus ocellatus]